MKGIPAPLLRAGCMFLVAWLAALGCAGCLLLNVVRLPIEIAAYEARSAAAEEAERERRKRMELEIRQPGTQLYWRKCAVGQEWTGSFCKGDRQLMIWSEALEACPPGFRLPTRAEIVSLLGGCDATVDAGKKGRCSSCAGSEACTAIFVFDGGWYWSSSTDEADPSRAWHVDFETGNAAVDYKDNNIYVRCVFGGVMNVDMDSASKRP